MKGLIVVFILWEQAGLLGINDLCHEWNVISMLSLYVTTLIEAISVAVIKVPVLMILELLVGLLPRILAGILGYESKNMLFAQHHAYQMFHFLKGKESSLEVLLGLD